MAKITNTQQLRDAVRNGQYAWPGGYPLFFICADGEALSFSAVRENYKQVLSAVKHGDNAQWQVIGVEINWEDAELFCAHTNNPIEAAYC